VCAVSNNDNNHDNDSDNDKQTSTKSCRLVYQLAAHNLQLATGKLVTLLADLRGIASVRLPAVATEPETERERQTGGHPIWLLSYSL